MLYQGSGSLFFFFFVETQNLKQFLDSSERDVTLVKGCIDCTEHDFFFLPEEERFAGAEFSFQSFFTSNLKKKKINEWINK